ncbi:hypothetical protein RJ639_020654 [Escallonia herrerae]|uniref:Uncharacterized protein n=1 Tax=Escallonia herrerae TaxID=1293975 RepID=A0AA88V4L4_9ASTE|nr:hypothetical protein RJ639_020654 [Escallonia herrerae]
MWQAPYRKNDVETGSTPLYPMMLEAPELRWAFIRKVYSVVALQLLLTIAVGAVVVTYRPIATFFVSTGAGLALYIVLIITPFIGALVFIQFVFIRPFVAKCGMCYLYGFRFIGSDEIHWDEEANLRKVILESVILTTVVVVSLTLYTFWAARRGHDFNFLGPFLFGALMMLFPLGKVSVMIYGGLASIIFCGYILYDTDNLIKRYSYDEYIWAAVALYLDIINLFLSLLTIFRAAEIPNLLSTGITAAMFHTSFSALAFSVAAPRRAAYRKNIFPQTSTKLQLNVITAAAFRVSMSPWERTLTAELTAAIRWSRSAPMASAASTH